MGLCIIGIWFIGIAFIMMGSSYGRPVAAQARVGDAPRFRPSLRMKLGCTG
jgi:hypothetical protein